MDVNKQGWWLVLELFAGARWLGVFNTGNIVKQETADASGKGASTTAAAAQ